MTQYTVLKVDKEDRIYVPTVLKYVGQIGTESKYANKYSGLVCLEFEDGNAWRFRNEWLEKVEEKEMESKFNVGDKVRFLGGLSEYKVVGEHGGLVFIKDKTGLTYRVASMDLELVTEPKQDQPIIENDKKYRVVQVEKDWKYYDPILEEYLYMEGFVYDNSDEDGLVEILFDDGNTWSFAPEWLVPVEEEENQQSSQDNVNFPSHYQLINDIEVKDVVKVILSRWQSSGQEMSFNQAGMMKELLQYLLRAPLKNKKEDVLKAQWYLNELVKEWEEK